MAITSVAAAISAPYRRRRLEQAYLRALLPLPGGQLPSGDERAAALETLCLLDAALDRLPPRVCEVFLLSRFDRLPYATIAEQLGLPVGVVRQHMLQAARVCFAVMVD